MSKQFCMAVGCVDQLTDVVIIDLEGLDRTGETADNKDIWTAVRVCQTCHNRLDDHFDGKPIYFDGFPIETIQVLSGVPNSEGFSKANSLWYMVSESDLDDFDNLDVGLFDKEALNINVSLVDVENG